jgi:hypothetical protein
VEEKVISPETRKAIKGYLEGFIQGLIEEHKSDIRIRKVREERAGYTSSQGILKPFHEAIISPEVLRISAFERSFSTKLGSTFEECAALIAAQQHKNVKRNYAVAKQVSLSALQEIEKMIGRASQGHGVNFLEMVGNLLKDSDSWGREEQGRLIIADLYFEHASGGEYFFEIKSPKPNKGQCLEVTERLLRIHAANKKGRPAICAYFAMPYNPYGRNKEDYKHGFSIKYLDMQNQVLLGSEFWELIGGSGTYDELLDIYAEVGRENSKKIIDALAFGFGWSESSMSGM